MLVRAFRVTDRLGNAFLRISAWTAMSLVQQTATLKNGLFGIVMGIVLAVVGTIKAALGTMRFTSRTARQAYTATYETAATRRHEIMVQRAAEAELKPAITEDPLLRQNRALSAFAVLLLLALLAVVVIQTNNENTPSAPAAGGRWPESRGTPVPTALFPTPIPTATLIPDPLKVGGSLVFTLRENGQEDLWTLGVGESAPLRLTNDPADDRDPAWSPDGTRVAFSSHRDGNWELYLMQIDTGAITRLTYTPGFEGTPSWSPDGAYLAYEGYYPDSEDLDIYIISADPAKAAEEGAIRVTYTPGPDFEPTWSPQGRSIAYTSWRNGSQEILIISLDPNGGEAAAANLTGTPDIDENYAAWSHDGTSVAYSALVNGVEGVYVKPAQQPDAEPILVGRGRMPAYAPNDASVAYMLDYGRQTQILTGVPGNFGAAPAAIALPTRATDPDWTKATLPRGYAQSGGVPPNPTSGPLYQENARQKEDGLYGMAPLNNIDAPQAYLSDRVNDSFEALRLRTLEKSGYDFLGSLDDAFWKMDRPPEPGEPRENWHYAGRAFSINRDLIYAGYPTPIEVVREDVEVNTSWRVFLRVADEAQNGVLGEPLRRIPWDFTARSSGDPEDYERGGRLMSEVPKGYYIDLTQLADDYGWERPPAGRTWQYNFGAIQFWVFFKSDNLGWNEAMLELYTPAEMQAFLSEATHVPPPPPLPTESPTLVVRRTATPIPPDTQ